METLIVKIRESSKAPALVEMLKSMDFISSVDYFEDLQKTRDLFAEINQIASETDLSDMTMDDINDEIKQYRLEKKLDRH